MSEAALALILASAFVHASWNFLAKKASGGPAFVWLFTSVAALIEAPIALGIVLITRPSIGWLGLAFMAGTGILHAAYFLSLQKGYEVGDLSLVYPLARGMGPLLAAGAAIALFDERPSGLAISGAVLIGLGAMSLTRAPKGEEVSGVGFALVTAGLIASYTLWDKYAVATLAIPPILYDWANNFGRGLVLLPFVATHRSNVTATWRAHRREVIGVGVLSPVAYVLVLTALSFTPVSYVAPAREISIVIGTAMGAYILSEGDAARRLLASSAMVAGLVALALG